MNFSRATVLFLLVFLLLFQRCGLAATFALPEKSDDSLVGAYPVTPHYVTASYEDTLLDVARRHDIGQNEIVLLNPGVDRWIPGEQASIRIPASRILPDTPRKGMTLNLPEFRLYFYPPKDENAAPTVITHPISIGRQDWETPLGKTAIISKKKDPTWTPPESIREEHAAMGEVLPETVAAGPENPLGQYALRLGVPGYLIHGTNKPYGVGMRVSHGCIRMYPEDIEALFAQVDVGVPVYIVDQPIKVGWYRDILYIEVYPPLEGKEASEEEDLDMALKLIRKVYDNQQPVIDFDALKRALSQKNGIPTAISRRPVTIEAGQGLF